MKEEALSSVSGIGYGNDGDFRFGRRALTALDVDRGGGRGVGRRPTSMIRNLRDEKKRGVKVKTSRTNPVEKGEGAGAGARHKVKRRRKGKKGTHAGTRPVPHCHLHHRRRRRRRPPPPSDHMHRCHRKIAMATPVSFLFRPSSIIVAKLCQLHHLKVLVLKRL